MRKHTEIKIGDKVKIVESISWYFLKGDIVEVCEIDPDRGYGFKDNDNHKVIECGWDCCELI